MPPKRLLHPPVPVPALLVALALAGAAPPAGAFEGRVNVVDGDTVELMGGTLALWGIDAPEDGEICIDAGRRWDCGRQAVFALARLIENHWLRCEQRGRTGLGQPAVVCTTLAGHEINRDMVAQGWARADRAVTDTYVPEEDSARTTGLGIWSGAPDPRTRRP